MAPALNLRHEQRVYLREGRDGMVVQNVGSRIRQTRACILARPLPVVRPCILFTSLSLFSHLKKGDDNK